jgi:hypothetical protein
LENGEGIMLNKRTFVTSMTSAVAILRARPSWAIDTTISVKDSVLQQALDLYYDFLLGLVVDSGPPTRLLLNNTITSFDISADTPFYNEGLFRNFADRVFRNSPQGIGPANRADRFSLHYSRLISQAAAAIDQDHPGLQDKVDAIQAKLQSQQDKLTKYRISVSTAWASLKIPDADPDYHLKYINYLESVHYASQIKVYSDTIDNYLGQIDGIRRNAYSPSEQLVLDVLYELQSSRLVARPTNPRFERQFKNVTDLTFGDPTVRVDAFMDVSPSALPVGDMVKFLSDSGSRGFAIDKSHTAQHHHESSWNGSGSASFPLFSIPVSLGGGGSGSSSWDHYAKTTNTIAINYDNIAEYNVDRGMWYDPAIFDDTVLNRKLSKLSEYKSMQNIAISLVIARGTSITLTFDDALDDRTFTHQNIEGHGGISILGYGFGAKGGEFSTDWTVDISTDKRTVTFKDGPTLARVVAFRVEPVIGAKTSRMNGASRLQPK